MALCFCNRLGAGGSENVDQLTHVAKGEKAMSHIVHKPCAAKVNLRITLVVGGLLLFFWLSYQLLTAVVPPKDWYGSIIQRIYLPGSLLIAVLFGALEYIGYMFMEYELHEDQVVVKSGIFWKRNKSMPYHKLTDAELLQGPLERMFGFADLALQTAGSGETEATLTGLENYNRVQETVRRNIQKSKNAPPIDNSNLLDEKKLLQDILQELRQIKAKL